MTTFKFPPRSYRSLPDRRLAWVGVGASVDQLVAVGWPTAQEPTLEGSLGGHRRTNPGLDAVAFAFSDPAVEAHHEIVSVGARNAAPPTSGTHSPTP